MTKTYGYVRIAGGKKMPHTEKTVELARAAAQQGLRAEMYIETDGPLTTYGADSDADDYIHFREEWATQETHQ